MADYNFIFIGDVVGSTGRKAIKKFLPELKKQYQADVVIANVENAAHGFGLTKKTAQEILDAGVDLMTGGNHIFDKKEVAEILEEHDDKFIRPANYPPDTPGVGSLEYRLSDEHSFGVINLMGRVFMDPLDCPFRAFDRERQNLSHCKMIFVDLHAEATSEKAAMSRYIDGKASMLVGTHTHIQTADERVLPNGLGFLTDVGMTGPEDSIIGMKIDGIVDRFVSKRPVKMEVAEGPAVFQAVYFKLDPTTGRCREIERIRKLERTDQR